MAGNKLKSTSSSSLLALTVAINVAGEACAPLAKPQAQSTRTQKKEVPPSPCIRFEWGVIPELGEKAVLAVPLQIQGESYWFQLDSGLDKTAVFDPVIVKHAERQAHHRNLAQITVDGDFGPKHFEDFVMVVVENMEGEPLATSTGKNVTISGAIGLDLLAGSETTIDYPNQEICIRKESQQLDNHPHAFHVQDVEVRRGKLFVPVMVENSLWTGIFFDTGASIAQLLVDLDDWRLLTGKTGAEEDLHVATTVQWGETITVVSSPASQPLAVAGFTIEAAQIQHIREKPDLFADFPFPARGMMGNAPFFSRAVVLDLVVEGRFRLGISVQAPAHQQAAPPQNKPNPVDKPSEPDDCDDCETSPASEDPCTEECIARSQMRAVAPEQIELDCRRQCQQEACHQSCMERPQDQARPEQQRAIDCMDACSHGAK